MLNYQRVRRMIGEMTDFTSPYSKWPRHGGLAEYSKMIQEIEGTLNTEDWLSQCVWCLNPSFGSWIMLDHLTSNNMQSTPRFLLKTSQSDPVFSGKQLQVFPCFFSGHVVVSVGKSPRVLPLRSRTPTPSDSGVLLLSWMCRLLRERQGHAWFAENAKFRKSGRFR